MEQFTEDTMKWLDERFNLTTPEGIYFAHQPIYGFRKGKSESFLMIKYLVTYQIIKCLSHLKFNSLIDIGGAEGYKAALIRSIFNVQVKNSDLSLEAIKRAREIYGIDGDPIDIHNLPYKNEEFDVVLCSETLEHVKDFKQATEELLRIAKKAVVITVPHDKKEFIEKNLKEKIPHAHIHLLDLNSFDFAAPMVDRIITHRMMSPFLKFINVIIEANKIDKEIKYPRLLKLYNVFVPFLQKVFGIRAVSFLLRLDDLLSNKFNRYAGMSFILLKDKTSFSETTVKEFSPSQVIDFKVPYYYLSQKKNKINK